MMTHLTVVLYGIAWDTEVDGQTYIARELGLPGISRPIAVDAASVDEALDIAVDYYTEEWGYCIRGFTGCDVYPTERRTE